VPAACRLRAVHAGGHRSEIVVGGTQLGKAMAPVAAVTGVLVVGLVTGDVWGR